MEFTAKHHNDDNNETALHCWYRGQSNPQQVQIAVDLEDGEVTVRYNPEVGNAITAREYDGIWLTHGISQVPTVTAANELIDQVVTALNETCTDNGWSVGNFAPHGDAAKAIGEEIERVVDLFSGNTVGHVGGDRDQPLAVWDECGNWVSDDSEE